MKWLHMQCKQRFSIRKLSIGVVSLSLGSCLLSGKVQAEAPSTSAASNVEAAEQVAETQQDSSERVSEAVSESGAQAASSAESQQSTVPPTSDEAITASEESKQQEATAATQSTENQVKNGDFSETTSSEQQWTQKRPQNWTLWIPSQNKSKTYQVGVTENEQLVLSSKETFRGVVHQELPIDATQTYELKFDLKTEALTGSAKIRLIEKREGKQLSLWYSDSLKGTHDWTTLTKVFKPHVDTTHIRMELFYETGTGKAYFDNVSLTYYQPRNEQPHNPEVESEITLREGKVHVLNRPDYRYHVRNHDIVQFLKGTVLPKTIGSTMIDVMDAKGQFIKSIKVNVVAETQTQQHYRKLLQQWGGMVVGNQRYDAKNTAMSNLFQQLEKDVTQLIAQYNHEPNRLYLWQDASNYNQSANLTKTYRKFESIAKQITNRDSQFYQDVLAIQLVKDGMAWLDQHVYNASKEIVGNWWDYEIGTPRAINNTLTLLHAYFSDEEIERYTKVIDKFVPNATYFRSTTKQPFKAEGGNLVDMGRVKIIEAILRQDDTMLREAIQSVEQVFTNTTKGEGFYREGSYIAHTNVAYTGAYGSVLIEGISQLLPIIQKSHYPISVERLAVVKGWIERAFVPLIIHGELADLSRGRSISRESAESHVAAVEVLRGILRIADAFPTAERAHIRQTVKSLVKQDHYYDVYRNLKTYQDISLMQQLLSDTTVKVLPNKTMLTLYHYMDKVIFYNAEKGYGFAISMHSNRTKNYESINGENKKGWYTGDGMVYFYNGDQSHYSDNYWATVDFLKLPGTTILNGPREDASGQQVGHSGFVGGTKLNSRFGSVAMSFMNWNQQLSAKKAWFIFGDKIVQLGAGIQNKSTFDAWTTLENRKLGPGGQYNLYLNQSDRPGYRVQQGDAQDFRYILQKLQSLFMEGNQPNTNVGYWLLTPSDVVVQNEQRSGTWRAINQSQSDTVHTNRFLSIQQQHHKAHDTYAYVMYPNVTRQAFNQAIAHRSIRLLHNTEWAQVVYDQESQTWGAVKYDDTPIELAKGLVIKRQGVYTIQRTATGYKIAYHHPGDPEQTTYQEIVASSDMLQFELIERQQDTSEVLFNVMVQGNRETPAPTPMPPANHQREEAPKSLGPQVMQQGGVQAQSLRPFKVVSATTTPMVHDKASHPQLFSWWQKFLDFIMSILNWLGKLF